MSTSGPNIQLMSGLRYPVENFAEATYYGEVSQRGHIFACTQMWMSPAPKPTPEVFDTILYWNEDFAGSWISSSGIIDGCVVKMDMAKMVELVRYTLIIYGPDPASTRQVMQQFRDMLPEQDTRSDAGRVQITFWSTGPRGPMANPRMLSVPSWADVSINYESGTQDGLARLMARRFNPEHGGKLLLWSGPPGLGKTFALRSLCREWSHWSRVNYILDPEAFLTDSGYMQQVLLQGEDPYEEVYGDFPDASNIDDLVEEAAARGRARERRMKWRIILMEDTGELLAKDAKERTGQGLSRLLNITDGMIGQGLRVLVLITTNEDLGSMHPAVIRDGRCAANIKFNPFSQEEAREWLRAHGHSDVETKERTLAQLYAVIGDTELISTGRPRQPAGFIV